ncbi:PREDICTED: alpha-2-macroglobulin-like protein 1 [Acanthisitta chloris]|uniref:alpha-2-macroglobulin-like protein 1 n=1 Tax=Acanthisitta chloris TaxID=57068 RepID=UPI0004F0E257|nr:PREDICTED: alpha-2-macroglobulin-like protein 1 [Acanthisitta chloris]
MAQKVTLVLSLGSCCSYTGNRVSTNMVLIQVELLSGYSPVAGSLEELKKMPLVKKVESKADQVVLYLEELTRQPQTYTFLLEQDIQVKDHKPANIKVYDYYMPGTGTEPFSAVSVRKSFVNPANRHHKRSYHHKINYQKPPP